ncbi:MAG: ATP phosphoribosyltransferase [Methanobacteriaceae archaeon]|jgi:ATP phosphoribosyltransferase
MEKIVLGLPKGSLNNVNRGNTYQLFVDAGYEIKGYEPGKEENEIIIANDLEIKAFLSRPQSMPVELNRGILDLAIVGEDWVREESVNLEGEPIIKIGDLEYGQTDLIVAVPTEDPYDNLTEFFRANAERKTPVLCFTEYPNLARQHFMQNDGYRELFGDSKPLVQVRGLWNGDNKKVQIINSDGATEVYIAKGADLVVDNTQTGGSLKKAGLKIIETIMKSSAGLYAGPGCKGRKAQKAKTMFEQLFGAIEARKYFDVKFNISNDTVDEVNGFLVSRHFCSNEPTVVKGKSFSQVNVLIPKTKFPAMLRGIKSYGASAIVRENVKQYVK